MCAEKREREIKMPKAIKTTTTTTKIKLSWMKQ